MNVVDQARPGFRGRPLGLLTHVAGLGGVARVYRETVELAVAAEELGYSSFWVAQHHGSPADGLLPSPLVLLAAVAERTSTIRLGTGVLAAGLEDPRRLAEDAAVLDALCGGRLELGVGSGSDAAAAATFGRDHDRRHRDCLQVVDELCLVLGGPWLVPAAAGLRARLWWASSSAAGVRAAGTRGIGLLSGRPADQPGVVDAVAGYREVAEAPRVAMCRIVDGAEPVADAVRRWDGDPVLPHADEVIVQHRPATAGFGAQLDVLQALAAQLRPVPVRA